MLCTEAPRRLEQRLRAWTRAAHARGVPPRTLGAQIVQLLQGMSELGMLGQASDPLLLFERNLQAEHDLKLWEEDMSLRAFDDT